MRSQCSQFKVEFGMSLKDVATKLDKSVVWVRFFLSGEYKNTHTIFTNIRKVSQTLGLSVEDIAKYAFGQVGATAIEKQEAETNYAYYKRLQAILSSEKPSYDELITRKEFDARINKLLYGEE
jgi:hypothetical protein